MIDRNRRTVTVREGRLTVAALVTVLGFVVLYASVQLVEPIMWPRGWVEAAVFVVLYFVAGVISLAYPLRREFKFRQTGRHRGIVEYLVFWPLELAVCWLFVVSAPEGGGLA